MAEPYLVAKIKAWAIFPEVGLRFDDVISVSATFALNTIPTASVVVAVGKAFSEFGEITATIHKNKEKLKPRTKAEVYVKIEDLEGTPMGGIKRAEYKVFDGYVAGIGYQRSHNHANYVINLVHWLDDLNNSSAINGNWFPGVPHDWAQQAMYDQIGEGGKISSYRATPGVSAKFAKLSNLKADTWEKTIKPLLLTVAGFAGGEVQERKPPAPLPKLSNDAAVKALEKMPGTSPTYVPLALSAGAESVNISKSISSFFTQTMTASFAQNSMWSKLLNDYASQFFFAISPAVDWATPIPFCAGVRWKEGAPVITAKEYNYANFNANMSQILEAVYIHYPVASATNLPNGPSPDANLSFYRPWASHPEDGKAKKGLKLFKNVPAWLANLDPGYLRAAFSVRGRWDSHGTRTEPPPPNPPPEKVKDAHNKQKPLAKKIAEHWYFTEILQQRYGELAGPLRFDLAPGSIIKIMTPPRDVDLGDKNPFVCASIISVSYIVNAERATAGTSFTIAHQKTSEENKDDLYSVDKPPLYQKEWLSGPLANAIPGAGDGDGGIAPGIPGLA